MAKPSGYENEFGTAPMWPLIMKISIGLLAAAQGVKLINAGGESDADSL